ncbi:MAG: LysR family transcriptional regulator [Pseudomonadales bacterium]
MDVESLKAFVAVAEARSFSKAADALFLTQPAISKRIAKLENDLDTLLFDRIGRQIQMTEAGRALLTHAHRIFTDITQAERAVRAVSTEVSGQLRIATSHHIGLHHLPPILKAFADRYPGVRLQIEFTDSEKAHDEVLHGNLEVAVITMALQEDPHIVASLMRRDPLSFMVSNNHPLAADKEIELSELSAHSCILPGLDTYTGQIVNQLFTEQKLSLDASMATNYLETVKMLTSVGMGWTVLPKTMLDSSLKELKITGVQLERLLGYIVHRDHQLSPAAKAFISLLDQTN